MDDRLDMSAPAPIRFREVDVTGAERTLRWQRGDNTAGVPDGYVAVEDDYAIKAGAYDWIAEHLEEWSIKRLQDGKPPLSCSSISEWVALLTERIDELEQRNG